MLTDVTPRKANRARFLESERIRALDLPQSGHLLAIAKSIEAAMKGGAQGRPPRGCGDFLARRQSSIGHIFANPQRLACKHADAAWTFGFMPDNFLPLLRLRPHVWHLSGLTRLPLGTRQEVAPGPEEPS